MIFEDYCFDVMNKDDLIAKVAITNNRKTVNIERFCDIPAIQPFCGSKLDLERVYEFISYRCFEEGRPDKDELLSLLGLKEYNPWEIVKVTHGRLWEDFLWIRFPGETITWKDVSYGRV